MYGAMLSSRNLPVFQISVLTPHQGRNSECVCSSLVNSYQPVRRHISEGSVLRSHDYESVTSNDWLQWKCWNCGRTMSLEFPQGSTAPSRPGPPHCWGFEITVRHTTLGRTSLDEWSARRWNLYLTTHNTHKRETSMLPAGFEPAIPASELPQTHALDRAATGIGSWK
jgi:hypothetical protein